MPASGSSSSTGASEPFASSAPASSSERYAYAPCFPSHSRSARSRSDGAWLNWTDAVTPISAKRATSASSSSCACSMRGRRPAGSQASRVASKASSAARLAASPIACTATGQPASAPRRTTSSRTSRELISTPEPSSRRAVRRAERPVHEALQVAEPQHVATESGAQAQPAEIVELVPRERLPDAHVELVRLEQALEHLERAEPAVLVVDRNDAARGGHPHPRARRLEHLVDGRAHVAVAEGPRRVLAQDAALLDHSSRHLERPVGALERRAVHPERVVVLRHQRHRQVRHRAVERLAGRRLGPVALAPAEAAQPAALRDASSRLHHAVERLLQRAHALEPRLPQPERPGREVHVRVGEAGQHAAPAQLDHPGAGLVVVHDPRAANGQPPHDGGSRVERSDRPAGEQHRRKATRACAPRCAGSRAASPSPRSAGAAPRAAAGSTASRRASRAARRS